MSTERQIPEVGEEIHLPGPSSQPLQVAISTTIAIVGVTMTSPVYTIVGTIWLLIVLGLWIRDARAEFKALPDHHGDHGDHGDHAGHGDHAEAAEAH